MMVLLQKLANNVHDTKSKSYHSGTPTHQLKPLHNGILRCPPEIAFLALKKKVSAVHIRRGRSIRIEPTHPDELLASGVHSRREGLDALNSRLGLG